MGYPAGSETLYPFRELGAMAYRSWAVSTQLADPPTDSAFREQVAATHI